MRRARISIKPNVRPGSRSVAPTAEVNGSQESTAVDDTQKTPSPSPQPHPEVKESAATGDGNVPGSPSVNVSLNTNDGAPSSATTLATTAPQRRSRFSATPNLARPKVRSAAPASAGKTASLPPEPSKTSSPLKTASSFPQAPVPDVISRDDPQKSTLSDATTTVNCPPSSSCLPPTSGCPESPPSTPSLQEPCQTPKRIPNEDTGSQQGATPRILSPCVKLSRVDGTDGATDLNVKMSSDKQRVLRALKLKELMKLERRKELMKKGGRHKREHCIEMDREKMTLADFIYYLPESNPMKSSLSKEESAPQSTAPPSPVVQKSTAEAEEDVDEDEDDDDDMLVPKVRVAEDGSLILDEESLTVRVQRTSKTVVDTGNALFELGSTTTYSSFRKNRFVPKWSIRETDMFYLAISMVGTDFSLIGQLLTHRSRAEIMRKFRREEKENAWRVDKAFRNKRPYDAEFFGFLLKRILAKDKEKGNAIKLVVKSSKKPKKGKGGKKAKSQELIYSEDDDELSSVDSACLDLEKENEDNSNVNEADLPSATSKKRKRTTNTKQCEKTCEPKKKNRKKTNQKSDKCPAEGEDSDLVCVEVDSVGTDNEDQSCLSESTKKRKKSKKGDQEGKENKNKKDAKEKLQKKTKKQLEVLNEEPTAAETGAVNEERSEESTAAKKRKRSKKCPEEDKKPTNRKATTKKSKTSQEECSESEPCADGSEVSAAALSVEEDQGEKLIPESAAQEEISQSSSKRSKRPVPNLAKRKAKISSEPKATVSETEDTVEAAQDESCREAESELRILSVAEKQLQKQPVVFLERTPPRFRDLLSSSESQDHPESPQSPQRSPGRQMRAEKVKRNLTASDDACEALKAGLCAEENQREKLIPEYAGQEEDSEISFKSSPVWQTREENVAHRLMASEEKIDECRTVSDTSPEDMRTAAMPDHVILQRSEHMEADQRMEEGIYLPHLEFLTTSEVNGKTLLKRAVVLVSCEEVEHYLSIQAQTNADESESQPDITPARAHHEEDHSDGHEEQGSSGVTLETRLSQDSKMKENNTATVSAQQNVTEQRRRFSKPTPNLSRSGQSCHRLLNEQTTEFSQNTLSFEHDFTQPQNYSPVEEQVDAEALNEELKQEHRERPEEESTCIVTPEEESSLGVEDQDDIESLVDDLPSFSSVETPPRAKEIGDQDVSSFLEKPQVPDTTPSDKDILERRTELETSPFNTFEIEDQEEEDSEPCESEITDTVIDETQTELERIQSRVSPQSSEPGEDPAEIPESQPCGMDQDTEIFSWEEKPLSSEVDLQECKQDEDLLSLVPLLGSTQTSAPQVPLDCTVKANKEPTDEVLSDAASEVFEPHSPDSSFSDHPTEHTSNMCDVDTLTFSAPATEDVQIPDEQVSQDKEDTEGQSAVSEDCSVNLNETAKSGIVTGVEIGSTDKQSEEEPTFILTLYEIPADQLFQEAASGQQDAPPYELQPAQFHTPSLFSGCSQPLSFTLASPSASLHMGSEETEKTCNSTSQEDDSPVPLSKDAADAKDAATPLISSEESSCEDVNSVISAPEMLSCNSAKPTDVLKMEEKQTEISKTKAPTQRRSKIKVKPNLLTCVKAGASGKGQLGRAHSQSLPSSHAKAQTKTESKIPAQETVDPVIPENSDCRAGHDSMILIVPVSEEEHRVKEESPLRTDDQTDEDFDPPVLSTAVNESVGESEDGRERVSHMVLADAFVISSGEMEDAYNKDMESLHDNEPQKAEDLSVRLPDREKSLCAFNDQREKVPDMSEEPDTCSEASGVTSSADHNKSVPFEREFRKHTQSDIGSDDLSLAQAISAAHLIKEELEEKAEERTEQDYFSEEEFDRGLTEISECTYSPPIDLRIKGRTEDVSHMVLSDILVPVSDQMKDDVHVEGSPVLQMCEESQQALSVEEDQDTHSHEGVSHMLLTDILIPVCEDTSGDLSQDWMTAGQRSPHEAERPLVREDPDYTDLLCAETRSSNVGPLTSPKRKKQTEGKLLVKMMFPMRGVGDSPKSSTLNSPEPECISEPKCASTQSSSESFTVSDVPIGPEDHEEACGGVSHMVLSDFLVPVLDEVVEHSIHKEELSVGLQEDAVKPQVEKSTDIERPSNTERVETTARRSMSVEWKTPSSRRSTLRPKPKFPKRTEDPSESDLHLPGSTPMTSAIPQPSLDPQAEEWSLKSNMLPMDSDEMENWCEGVSQMLLSDAVPEENGEKCTDTKVLESSSLKKVEESALRNKKPSESSDEVHQLHTTADVSKTDKLTESVPASQAKKSPARSTFQMTLRSPERRLKDQPHVLKSPQTAPKTPQRPQTLQSPTRQYAGESPGVCRVQLERLSIEEIRASQRILQPKHHSTPVTGRTQGIEMHKASPTLRGSRSPGLESRGDEEPLLPMGFSPKVVLHRVPLLSSPPSASPARVSSTACRPPSDLQSPQNSPPVSDVESNVDPSQVSEFFLDDIFMEVVDPD